MGQRQKTRMAGSNNSCLIKEEGKSPSVLLELQLFLLPLVKYCQEIQDHCPAVKNYIHCTEDLLPVVLSDLISLKLLRDERVEGTIIKKEICKQFSISHHAFFPLFQEIVLQQQILIQLLTQLLLCCWTECCGFLIPRDVNLSSIRFSFIRQKVALQLD